jgi:hypothetical protein
VRNKQVTVAVLMFILVVASIHLDIPEVMGQEVANSSSKGTASQSVTPTIHENQTRLAAFSIPREEAFKSGAPAGAAVAQVTFESHDVAPASLNKGYGENDKCDCAESFFPQGGIEIPSNK